MNENMQSQSPIWDIEGADPKTGAKRTAVVRAETQKMAEAQADFMVSHAKARIGNAKRGKPAKGHRQASDKAPAYVSLRMVSAGIVIIGYGVIAVSLASLMYLMTGESTESYSPLYWAAICLPFAISGMFLVAAGEGLSALRDMARNSFK